MTVGGVSALVTGMQHSNRYSGAHGLLNASMIQSLTGFTLHPPFGCGNILTLLPLPVFFNRYIFLLTAV